MAGRGLVAALGMFTVAPVPASAELTASDARRALRWLPLLGGVLGALAGLPVVAVRAGRPEATLVGAALAVALLALLTRGLHLDGLADTADGLGSRAAPDRALEIMRRSDIGPFGVVTLVLVLLLDVGALVGLRHGTWAPVAALALAAATGRLAVLHACLPGVRPARPDGFGALVVGGASAAVAAAQTVVVLVAGAGVAALVGANVVGWPAVQAAALAVAWALRRHTTRRLGGTSGDVFGALIEVATAVTLAGSRCSEPGRELRRKSRYFLLACGSSARSYRQAIRGGCAREVAMETDQPRSAAVFALPREDPAADQNRRLPRVTLACAGIAGAAGLVGLLGWILDVQAMRNVAPGLATMKANTAVMIVLIALSWLVPRVGARVALACGAVAGLIAAAQLAEYGLGRGLGVDQLLFTDPENVTYPGRTSFVAATCLLLLVICRLSAWWERWRLVELLALGVLVLGGLALLGYVYDVDSLYDLGPFSSIALHTVFAVLLLGIATLAAVPGGVLHWALLGRDAGANLMREVALFALVVLPVLGYLCLLARHRGWVDGNATVALVVVLCALAIGILGWVAARRLARSDDRRARALADLTELKRNLERQVQDRAAQLQLRREEIAVLEDRQRIAADLHDIVIQRLFAAGLFLQGASVATGHEVGGRVDAAVEAMDTAIKDLRASIFELGSRARQTVDLGSALDAVCAESARVLGFEPQLTVDDPDWEAETVRDDLLAVLREALANVARHAGASDVEVVLRTGDGTIGLTVTDNGRGITETPRSSGTRNMADRARQQGGECTWTAIVPRGTRVHWQVPGVPAPVEV